MKKLYLLIFFICLIFSSQAQLVKLYGVSPANGVLVVCNFHQTTQDLSQYRVSGTGMPDTPLYKLKLLAGNSFDVPGRTSVFFTGVPLSKTCGSVSLYLPGDTVNHVKGKLLDFFQYKCAGNENEDSADIIGVWQKGTYIKGSAPYFFTSDEFHSGVQYWSSAKLPLIIMRFSTVSLWNNTLTIKNAGVSNIDMGNSTICINGICYDSLSKAPVKVLKGSLNLAKNDSLIIGFDGIKLDTTSGSLALFAFANSTEDTTALLDYVQWGKDRQPFSALAQDKGIWDSMEYIKINRSGDSLRYYGDFTRNQIGRKYWKSFTDHNLVRLATVSLWHNSIYIKNSSNKMIDLSNNTICINGNCFDTLAKAPVNIIRGSLLLQPNDSVVIQISSQKLDTVQGSIALFNNANETTDTTALLDFVQWGNPKQSFSMLAQQKGIWDSATTVMIARPEDSLRYIGDYTRANVGNLYWKSFSSTNIGIAISQPLNFSVSPNPATDYINFTGIDLAQYDIYDVQGRLLLSGNFENRNYMVNTSGLKTGIYLLQVYTADQKSGTMKLVIAK